MALFRYEAVDRSGKVVRGAMDAANEQAVAQRLASMGYSLKAILPAAGFAQQAATSKTQSSAPAAGQTGFPVSIQPVVKLKDLARFYRQLATLIRSGMSPVQSMDELIGSTKNGKLMRACVAMKERITAGESLSKAMAAYPHLFPVHTIGIIWAGELGGYLDIALQDAATELEQEKKDNFFTSIGQFIACCYLFFFIIALPIVGNPGDFITQATVRGARLAGSTEPADSPNLIPGDIKYHHMVKGVLQEYTERFIQFCIPVFAGSITGWYIWKRLKRVTSVRRVIDAVLLGVPFWGNLHRQRAMSRFLRALNQLYQRGVPPASAWAAASMTVRNSILAARLRRLDEILRRPNVQLQQAFVESRVFPQEDIAMVGTGQVSGSMPEMLERMSDYHSNIASNVKNIYRLVSTIILVLVMTLLFGYVIFKAYQGFNDFQFRVPKILGLE